MFEVNCERSFYIDFEKNTFVKDGKPFRYVSGSLHPNRVPYELWQDRLDKMYAGGLNAIEIYVFWNEHEPFPGEYRFDGQYDIVKFIQMANQTGLYVILRAGPYICGVITISLSRIFFLLMRKTIYTVFYLGT